MRELWPFFSFFKETKAPPPPPRPRQPLGDPVLTDAAAVLLRAVGCRELAGQVAVCWHRRLSSTAGLARPASAQVLLNPQLREFSDEIDRTLRHELAHLVAHDRAKRRRITAHGPEWKQACADLGIPGESRCHSLPLPRRRVRRPYVYQCPACRYTLHRVRPINTRRRRLACHDCCRQHAAGHFDGRFEFIRVPS